MGVEKEIMRGRRVLVVEDEPLLAEELLEELQAVGAVPVGPAETVASALALLANEGAIDAALCNVYLRGELSFPVVDVLAARGIPCLFVTGNDACVREHYPDVPCHPKPSDMVRLIEALSALLNQAAEGQRSTRD